MDNPTIKFTILMNKGKLKGDHVYITCDLEDLQEDDLSSMLIYKGYLKEWCNMDEYTVINRQVIDNP